MLCRSDLPLYLPLVNSSAEWRNPFDYRISKAGLSDRLLTLVLTVSQSDEHAVIWTDFIHIQDLHIAGSEFGLARLDSLRPAA